MLRKKPGFRPFERGRSPGEINGTNKFLGRGSDEFGSEGHRGFLLAKHSDGKRGIVLATTTSFVPADSVVAGRLYEVAQAREHEVPRVVRRVLSVPRGDDWFQFIDEFYEFTELGLLVSPVRRARPNRGGRAPRRR
jgi:hypothetical protein